MIDEAEMRTRQRKDLCQARLVFGVCAKVEPLHESPVLVDAERRQPATRKKGGQREAELAQAEAGKGLDHNQIPVRMRWIRGDELVQILS